MSEERSATAPESVRRLAITTARVVRRKDHTPDLMTLWLEPTVPFSFKPGQYCTIGLGGVERPYSIVSAPHEPFLELFIELVPTGQLTPRLWRLKEGDEVSLRPRAKGLFTMDMAFRHHLMVATVTGIAPFMSMVRHYLHRGLEGHHFYILHGASYQDELVYDGELTALAQKYPHVLCYVPTISRPQEERNRGWRGQTGRVNTIVEEYIERFELSPHDTLVYLCGHSGMIADVKERLQPKGWRIKEEHYYWPPKPWKPARPSAPHPPPAEILGGGG